MKKIKLFIILAMALSFYSCAKKINPLSPDSRFMLNIMNLVLSNTNMSFTSLKETKAVGIKTPDDILPTELEWITTDSNVATVNSNGVVTSVYSGNAYILARAPGGSSVTSATCAITVAFPGIFGNWRVPSSTDYSYRNFRITTNKRYIYEYKYSSTAPAGQRDKAYQYTLDILDFQCGSEKLDTFMIVKYLSYLYTAVDGTQESYAYTNDMYIKYIWDEPQIITGTTNKKTTVYNVIHSIYAPGGTFTNLEQAYAATTVNYSTFNGIESY
ncbi:MAG: hypothetical protein A2096_16105 [Spirochaetes bacterium GWF1_41_5]|nr:MAG: hypothetical protein A2096_16105 [Spirochaetes bacterium GWF1_41_5]